MIRGGAEQDDRSLIRHDEATLQARNADGDRWIDALAMNINASMRLHQYIKDHLGGELIRSPATPLHGLQWQVALTAITPSGRVLCALFPTWNGTR
jgi:hypothetical protein